VPPRILFPTVTAEPSASPMPRRTKPPRTSSISCRAPQWPQESVFPTFSTRAPSRMMVATSSSQSPCAIVASLFRYLPKLESHPVRFPTALTLFWATCHKNLTTEAPPPLLWQSTGHCVAESCPAPPPPIGFFHSRPVRDLWSKLEPWIPFRLVRSETSIMIVTLGVLWSSWTPWTAAVDLVHRTVDLFHGFFLKKTI
jgi:hypothetical protein